MGKKIWDLHQPSLNHDIIQKSEEIYVEIHRQLEQKLERIKICGPGRQAELN